MFSRTFWLQLGLHALAATVAFLAGMASVLNSAPRFAGLAGLAALVAVAVWAAARLAGERRQILGHRSAARRTGEPGAEPIVRRDALTGTLNGSLLTEQLEVMLEGGRRSDCELAVLVLDLIDFKRVNATLGHAAGDLLLRHVAARLLANLRETDVLARIGADEFAIVQAAVNPWTTARLCERLLATVEEPFDLHGQETFTSMRLGVALHPQDGRDPETLLEHARRARERAKRQGGGFSFFDEALDAELRRRKGLERDLTRALDRGEFELRYQPRIDLASRRMVSVAAYLSWIHPELGIISPEDFLPLAEGGGLTLAIAAWMLEQACRQAVGWQRQGAPGLRVAVNLSPVQLGEADLASLVADALTRTGLAPEHLELEISARLLMREDAAALATLGRLREHGVRIAIVGFGIAGSSLESVRRFAFDAIEIDRSLVGALGHERSAAAIVRAILTLGRSLGMSSVALGVETTEQLTILNVEGCSLAQGAYFSPPVTVAEIGAMVRAGAAANVGLADIGRAEAVQGQVVTP